MEKGHVIKREVPLKEDKPITYPALSFLFLFGSVFGFVLEGLWCIIKVGHWENHSALVWGPFCIVYGLGAVVMYLFAYLLQKKRLCLQFVVLSFAGAIVEYFTSLFQELIFGSTSWDYSRHFLNIGGRVSLKMAAFWGVLGIIFVYLLYPRLKKPLQKLHGKIATALSILLSIFMLVNFAVSGAAVLRYSDRQTDTASRNKAEELLDQYYGDEVMKQIYPNMKFKKIALSENENAKDSPVIK